MLVLSRKLGEKIMIGNNVVVTVVAIDGGKIRLGVEAPDGVPILREELIGRIKAHGCTRCGNKGCPMCKAPPAV